MTADGRSPMRALPRSARLRAGPGSRVQVLRARVDEDRPRAHVLHDVGRGGEGEGRDEDVVARPDARAATRARWRAAVPLERATAWSTPRRSANSRFERVDIGPDGCDPVRSRRRRGVAARPRLRRRAGTRGYGSWLTALLFRFLGLRAQHPVAAPTYEQTGCNGSGRDERQQ